MYAKLTRDSEPLLNREGVFMYGKDGSVARIRSKWLRYIHILSIFDLYCTSKARYKLKVVLLHLWRVNVKTNTRIYPLADFFVGKPPHLSLQFLMNKGGEFSIKLGQIRQDALSSCSVSSQLRVFVLKSAAAPPHPLPYFFSTEKGAALRSLHSKQIFLFWELGCLRHFAF